jgi:hypothetical protein
MADTGARGITQWAFTGLSVAFAWAALVATSHQALAEAPRARVLWVRADHAYVALPEGGHAEEGDSVRFEDRGKALARGRVASVIRDEMAVVSLTSGTLERVKKLDRIRVIVTGPPLVRRATLRIALPTDDNLLFRCGDVVPRLPANAPPYRGEPIDAHLTRMTRDSSAAGPLWPDTLLVYFFYDPLDAEIALERGDVDVAVFWPGNLSQRMRENSKWHGSLMGSRSRGVLALTGSPDVANAGPDSAGAVVFNDVLFRGDLALRQLTRSPYGSWGGPFWAIAVDENLPGRAAIGKPLWKGNRHYSVPIPVSVARLVFLDAPADTAASSTFYPLFSVRCPVVCAPPLRPLVKALGVDAFADMPQCAPLEESRR